MAPTHDLTTVDTPIDDLRPHPHNPRNGDTDLIAESLVANGQYKPIVATADGTILAGNHTYAAAMELGWDRLAVVRLNIDPDSDDAHRIMLADNRTADVGRYDDALLIELLKSLPTLEGTGYVPADLSALDSLLNDASYFDGDEFADRALERAATARRAIVIKGCPEPLWAWWRNLPGGNDLERLAGLAGLDP